MSFEDHVLFFVFSLLATAVIFWPSFFVVRRVFLSSRYRLEISSGLSSIVVAGVCYVSATTGTQQGATWRASFAVGTLPAMDDKKKPR